MRLFAKFTEDGIPGWIGAEPIKGSEELPETLTIDGAEALATVAFLAGHRRLPDGTWTRRDPPPPPTPEEIAAAEAARLAAKAEQDARDAEDREDRLMRKMLRVMYRRLRGEITQAQFIAQSDAIVANFRH